MLHGATHTYLAALGIGGLAALVAPFLCRPLVRLWNRLLVRCRLAWLCADEHFPRGAVLTGAMLGTLSHIFFDSFMHRDMHPFAPFSPANGLIGVISIDVLNLACLIAVGLGVAAWLVDARRRRNTPG